MVTHSNPSRPAQCRADGTYCTLLHRGDHFCRCLGTLLLSIRSCSNRLEAMVLLTNTCMDYALTVLDVSRYHCLQDFYWRNSLRGSMTCLTLRLPEEVVLKLNVDLIIPSDIYVHLGPDNILSI